MSVARDLLWPSNPDILVRLVFLYVGQGESTVVLAAAGDEYRTMLIDINCDTKSKGINVPKLVKDLVDGKPLDVFVNTHPHSDHLGGLGDLAESVTIGGVWHSGHKPGKKHDDAYKALQDVIEEVADRKGEVEELKGSRSSRAVGDAECYVLGPAEYVSEDIEGEDPDTRYRRIHEQCAVLKFGTGSTWAMITGDADRDAWEKHITEYHKERLPAVVFSAPHHGSRTFFRYDKDDDPYLDAIEAIGPTYVMISAPAQEDSPHGHPHDDAVSLYEDEVGAENILHTGKDRFSFICDIYRDGELSIDDDKGKLADNYLFDDDNGNGGGKKASVTVITSRIDDRPMGQQA